MTNIVIVGCSRRKVKTQSPVLALDLYQGGYIPYIRERVALHPQLRANIFILSAKHGLIEANDIIAYYNQELTIERAKQLRPLVWNKLKQRFVGKNFPEEILLIAEPIYIVLIADLLTFPNRPIIHWEPDIRSDSAYVSTILDSWGWLNPLI